MGLFGRIFGTELSPELEEHGRELKARMDAELAEAIPKRNAALIAKANQEVQAFRERGLAQVETQVNLGLAETQKVIDASMANMDPNSPYYSTQLAVSERLKQELADYTKRKMQQMKEGGAT